MARGIAAIACVYPSALTLASHVVVLSGVGRACAKAGCVWAHQCMVYVPTERIACRDIVMWTRANAGRVLVSHVCSKQNVQKDISA